MAKKQDLRPPAAIGHVFFAATNVGQAAEWFETVGLRPIAATMISPCSSCAAEPILW